MVGGSPLAAGLLAAQPVNCPGHGIDSENEMSGLDLIRRWMVSATRKFWLFRRKPGKCRLCFFPQSQGERVDPFKQVLSLFLPTELHDFVVLGVQDLLQFAR